MVVGPPGTGESAPGGEFVRHRAFIRPCMCMVICTVPDDAVIETVANRTFSSRVHPLHLFLEVWSTRSDKTKKSSGFGSGASQL